MPRTTNAFRRSALVLLSALPLVALDADGVRAQDGLAGFFRQLFSGGAPVRPEPPPGYFPGGAPFPSPDDAPRRARRPKVRLAALPDEVAKPRGVDERALALAKAGEVDAALLKDDTLRAGDIVVLKSGAKVFVGDRRERRTTADFESANQSAYLDKTTRKQLAAMVAPAAALPADEVRRVMATLKRATPARTLAPVVQQAQVPALRVVYPGQAGAGQADVDQTGSVVSGPVPAKRAN